jgi:hypothetical protein
MVSATQVAATTLLAAMGRVGAVAVVRDRNLSGYLLGRLSSGIYDDSFVDLVSVSVWYAPINAVGGSIVL